MATLRLATFEAVQARLEAHFALPGPARPAVGELLAGLAATHRVPYDTLRGMFANLQKHKSKREHKGHRARRDAYLGEYRRLVAAGVPGALVELADPLGVPPYLLARLVLEAIARLPRPAPGAAGAAAAAAAVAGNDAPPSDKVVEAVVKEWLRDIWQERPVAALAAGGVAPATVAADVVLAAQCDDSYGPLVDRVRAGVGLEHEYILHEQLHALGVPFMTEGPPFPFPGRGWPPPPLTNPSLRPPRARADMMRLAGYPKTPDVVLKAPLEVCGMLVYWVESKACFGDRETMETQFREQFHPYLRRIGPGVVLYWYGLVGDLADGAGQPLLAAWRAEGVLVLPELPADAVTVRHDLPPRTMRTWRDGPGDPGGPDWP